MTRDTEVVGAALDRGLDYLLRQQDAAGSWTDWALPPGPSSEWTTAYVGCRLAGLGRAGCGRLDATLRRAATWLLEHRFADGGWGYDPSVPSDADSTALAIRFLCAVDRTVPPDAYTFLRHFQREDGGFSTYLPDGTPGSWGRSHPEITPVAVLALLTDPAGTPDSVIERAVRWIRRARRADGTWDAFWWTTGLVATEASLACLTALGSHERSPHTLTYLNPDNDLQTALLMSILAGEGWSSRLETLTHRLIAAQRPDGSWEGEAALRVTRRDCDAPWRHADGGPTFADPKHLFTTVTVVAALSKAHHRLEHSSNAHGSSRRMGEQFSLE